MTAYNILLPVAAIYFVVGLELLASRFVRRLPLHMAMVWLCFAGAVVKTVLTDKTGLVASLGLDRTPLFSAVLVFWLFLAVVRVCKRLW